MTASLEKRGVATPIFRVRDLSASINCDSAALGFKLSWQTPNFAEVSREIAAASCCPKATKGIRETGLGSVSGMPAPFTKSFASAAQKSAIHPPTITGLGQRIPGGVGTQPHYATAGTLLRWPAD